MHKSRQIVYLPIRALGDFVITAAVVKEKAIHKIPILLPNYLTDLFQAIDGDKYFEIIGNINYNNQPAFFELYKVRDIKNIKRLFNNISIINSSLNKNTEYILDYSSRRLFFTMANMIWPPKNENIYDGKLKLFFENNLINANYNRKNLSSSIVVTQIKKIAIIPDSRIPEKCINTNLIENIINYFNEFEFIVARFSTNKTTNDCDINYSNFKELIEIINSFDLVISAESLPYHLANYLAIQHFVIYNKSRHFKTSFMTPFMINNKYYSIFNGSDSNTVIKDIEKILY